jgi:hypothetical protein
MQIFVKTLIDKTPHLQLADGSHDNFVPCLRLLVRTIVSASDYLFARVVSVSD